MIPKIKLVDFLGLVNFRDYSDNGKKNTKIVRIYYPDLDLLSEPETSDSFFEYGVYDFGDDKKKRLYQTINPKLLELYVYDVIVTDESGYPSYLEIHVCSEKDIDDLNLDNEDYEPNRDEKDEDVDIEPDENYDDSIFKALFENDNDDIEEEKETKEMATGGKSSNEILNKITEMSKKIKDKLFDSLFDNEKDGKQVIKVFVSSPLRGDIEKNMEKAKEYCRKLAMAGGKHSNFYIIPVAPHVYFPQFMYDDAKKERSLGLELGKELLKECDVVLVFDKDKGISEGMAEEIELANKEHIPVLKQSSLDFDLIF